MSRLPQILVALAIAAALGASAASYATPWQDQENPTPDVTGKWTMTLEMSMGSATPALELKQDGANLTGTYTGRYGTFKLQGARKGRAIMFSFNMNAEGQDVMMSFSGEVAEDGQSMKGTASLGEMGHATWSARRQG
jgi:hypothetical protein